MFTWPAGPFNLVWRTLAGTILEQCGTMGLAESLFLMDLNGRKLDSIPCCYKGLFKVWGPLKKERLKNSDSLFLLLKEPVVYGSLLQFSVEPTLLQRMCEARVLTLGHMVEVLCCQSGFTFGPEVSQTGQSPAENIKRAAH